MQIRNENLKKIYFWVDQSIEIIGECSFSKIFCGDGSDKEDISIDYVNNCFTQAEYSTDRLWALYQKIKAIRFENFTDNLIKDKFLKLLLAQIKSLHLKNFLTRDAIVKSLKRSYSKKL